MRFLARLVCAWTLCLPSARSREDAVLYLVQGRADQAARWLELTSSDPTAAPPLLPGTASGRPPPTPRDKFVWNHHLAFGLFRRVKTASWAPPIAHGFFLQVIE